MFKKGKTVNIKNIPINMACLESVMENKQYPEHNNAMISHILFPYWRKSGKSVDHIMPYITYEDGYVSDWRTIIQTDKLFSS